MRAKNLLASSCVTLSLLGLNAPVALSNHTWALSGSARNGYCNFDAGVSSCPIGTYSLKSKGHARQIGGFYLNATNVTPPQGAEKIDISYNYQFCDGSRASGSHVLSATNENWIGFPPNVCNFQYGLYKNVGSSLSLQFEMNYYLDY
jgi:hypothetical protein